MGTTSCLFRLMTAIYTPSVLPRRPACGSAPGLRFSIHLILELTFMTLTESVFFDGHYRRKEEDSWVGCYATYSTRNSLEVDWRLIQALLDRRSIPVHLLR